MSVTDSATIGDIPYMRLAAVAALLCFVAAGCGFRSSVGAAADAAFDGPVDGAVDSAPPAPDGAAPAPDACVSFAALLALDTCRLVFAGDLMIQTGSPNKAAVYDTDTHILTIDGVSMPVTYTSLTVGGGAVDVISARTVTIAEGTTLRAVGPRALVIAASVDILMRSGAQIDVSNGGAGGQTSCSEGAMPGAPDTGGAAGGGGGGYGADGGRGGNGNSDTGPATGGARGRAVTAAGSGLRGGCPGASGGKGDDSGGAGGKAGGALYLVAAGRIDLGSDVTLNAGGGPGQGSRNSAIPNVNNGDAGGGGGGSGGMLALEAAHIMARQAAIAANGGSGGGGGDSVVAGGDGNPGTTTTARASGGLGGGTGIAGGRGGSKGSSAGEDVSLVGNAGGGGGGGSVGVIRVKSADLQLGTVSPDPR